MADIRTIERESIRDLLHLAGQRGLFTGRKVLDYGCGLQPYREILTLYSPLEYQGYDSPELPASTVTEPIGDLEALLDGWGAIVCTQVIQYVPNPLEFLGRFVSMLADDGGVLVITWPTNWPEVEKEDLWRFTQAGMNELLYRAGFSTREIRPRGFIDADGGTFYLGHGAFAWPQ